MIPYQIGDKTYLLKDSFYWANFDLSMDKFNQLVLSSNFDHADLEDTFDSTNTGEELEFQHKEKFKTDKVDRFKSEDFEN